MTEILPQDTFKEMERRDEEQILAELEGKYLEEFVYQFPQRGKMVTGLSWAGIKEIAYRMGNITVELERIEENEAQYVVVVKANDKERGNSRLGGVTQSKILKHKDGTEEPDSFAFPKAISKAQRNAMRALMPEEMLKVWISTFLGLKTGKPEPKRVENQPEPKIISEEALTEALESAGLPPEHLTIYPYGRRLYLDPQGSLGDLWAAYNRVLKPFGAVWKEIGDSGRWELSL